MSRVLTFLFLGGAKRVAMAEMLSKAAELEGFTAKFVSYELDTACAIASVGKVVSGLRWSDPNLYDDLERVVNQYGINIVIPFVDAAVSVASRLAERCHDLFCPGGPAEMQDILFDKVKSAQLFNHHSFDIPQTYSGNPEGKHWIAKPRRGSASHGLVFLSPEEVAGFDNSKEEYLIQECILNHEEISVDCYISTRNGEILTISPRKRLETSGGEAIKTLTIADKDVTDFCIRIINALRLRGAVTIQFLRNLDSGRLMIMEINPRLGGGCTASVSAGANIPQCIVRDALGLTPQTVRAKAGVMVCRYLKDVIIKTDE